MDKEKIIDAISVVNRFLTDNSFKTHGLMYSEVEIVRFELEKVVEALGK